MRELNRGGTTTVELTAEEKLQLATSFMDTSSYCDGDKIYINANNEMIARSAQDEGNCAKACQDDEACDMYLMSDANTCMTFKNVSNVSAFCKGGGDHGWYGNLKKDMSDKIVRYPQTGGPEGFRLFGGAEPVVEGFWGSIWDDIKKAAKAISPPAPKCHINIIGDCPVSGSLNNTGWFNDKDHGGRDWPDHESCDKRRRYWSRKCGAGDYPNYGVYQYYVPSENNQPSPTLPPAQHTWTTYVKKTTEGFQAGDIEVPYTKMGPYKDEWKRALPDYKGTDKSTDSIDNCSKNCSEYNFFGVQDNGQCFCGNDWDKATQYGAGNCGEMGGAWCNYVYKHRNAESTVNQQAQDESKRVHNELGRNVREYARDVNALKTYNLDLSTMATGNSEAMDKAIVEYRQNIQIVAENRENKTWLHDKNIVSITDVVRKSHAYIYALWFALMVIVLIFLLRNAR
jgi:hypothetical protein